MFNLMQLDMTEANHLNNLSDAAPQHCEQDSHSKSKLIDVQHAGVNAKLSPLKSLLQAFSTSDETEQSPRYGRRVERGNIRSRYSKFSADTTDSGSHSQSARALYQMRAMNSPQMPKVKAVTTPSKIEFQLYQRSGGRRPNKSANRPRIVIGKHKSLHNSGQFYHHKESLTRRIRNYLSSLRDAPQQQQSPLKPTAKQAHAQQNAPQAAAAEVRIGIYPFEHGSAEYLRTTDHHPQLLSLVLAERATSYATRFWAEVFGTLHIGVAFIVTFMLQLYRFLLYSLVNTLLVGFLHMTSDYLIKPVLTVAFNGFLQPPLTLVHNIFCSMRDIMEPIAETLNNFLKPFGNVCREVRLVHVNNDYSRKMTKRV